MRQIIRVLAALPVLLALAGNSQAQNTVQINAAWYGLETGNKTDRIAGVSIVDKLRTATTTGKLVVPSNTTAFLGGDPFPNTKNEVLAVNVSYLGKTYNLRQLPGKDLIFPGTVGATYAPEPVDSPVSIRFAWYGLESQPQSRDWSAPIRAAMISGYVYVPADMNTFFGSDPNPGKVKRVAILVNYKGKDLNLRQIEGRPLLFPGVEGVDYMVRYPSDKFENLAALFDADFYALKNPDVFEVWGKNKGEMWNHYVRNGAREGRDPAPDVSIAALRMRYPYLQEVYGDDLAGYINHYLSSGGRNSIYNANPTATNFPDSGVFADPRLAYFDANYYFHKNKSVCGNPDLIVPKGTANGCTVQNVVMNVPALMEHYLTVGAKAGYLPNNMPMGAPQSANGKQMMRTGDWLGVNEYLLSRDGKNIAVMQANGDFAAYRTSSPETASAGNYGGHHTGYVSPDGSREFFIMLLPDSRLCTFKGRSPASVKTGGTPVHCANPPVEPVPAGFFMKMLGSNMVIIAGSGLFDDQGYVWDFVSNKPPKKSFWEKLNPIPVLFNCK